jgi:hypothetical protein
MTAEFSGSFKLPENIRQFTDWDSVSVSPLVRLSHPATINPAASTPMSTTKKSSFLFITGLLLYIGGILPPLRQEPGDRLSTV